MNINKLTPAIVIHPGELIIDEVLANNMSLEEFSEMTHGIFEDILYGNSDIDYHHALALEIFLGIDRHYWFNIQTRYEIEIEELKTYNT